MVRFELKGDAADTTVLFNGQLVRVLDLLRQKAPFYGLVAHAGVIPDAVANADDGGEPAPDANASANAAATKAVNAAAPESDPDKENTSPEASPSASPSSEPASTQEVRSARHVLVAQAAVGAVSVAGHTLLRSARASDGQLMAATLIPGEPSAVVTLPTAAAAAGSGTPAAEVPTSGEDMESSSPSKPISSPPPSSPPPVAYVPRPLPQPQGNNDEAGSPEVAWIREVGQFANDLVIERSDDDGSLVCPPIEEAYEEASRVRNVAVLQWRLEAVQEVGASEGKITTSLRPTFPVLAMGENTVLPVVTLLRICSCVLSLFVCRRNCHF